jgi:hypothetical protein
MEREQLLKNPDVTDRYQTRVERTGWRDEWISNRHREFGWNAAFTDIDFMGLEYDQGKPVCLIEYKHQNAKINLDHPSIQAQTWLADKAELPFFLVVYYPKEFQYYVVPINNYAKQVPYCQEAKFWSEKNFVKLLYFLRNRIAPEEILQKMSKTLDKNLPMPNFLNEVKFVLDKKNQN